MYKLMVFWNFCINEIKNEDNGDYIYVCDNLSNIIY